MDLPPCPVCGEPLQAESIRGPARCPSCGFISPVELDTAALNNLLVEASEQGLGRRPMLTHSREMSDLQLETKEPPSMLEAQRIPELPTLSPPPVPRELVARAPPALEDPRKDIELDREGLTRSSLASTIEERDASKKKDLRTRGELLK